MMRFKLRAVFAVVGLIVGATIWASAGISQESKSQAVPAAGLPGGAPPSVIPAPATGLPGRPGTPQALPQPVEPAVTPDPRGRSAPTPALPLGEPVIERLDRLQANPVGPPATGTSGFGIPGLPPSQQPVVGEMPALRVIPVESLNASSLKEIVETLIPTARGFVAVDAQTNSLVVRVSDATVDEIKKLALHLQEMKRAMPNANDAGRGSSLAGGSGFGAGLEGVVDTGASSGMRRGGGGKRLGEPVVGRQVSLAELKRDYELADKAARDFAASMKSSSKRNDDSLASLQNRIAYAFSLRQTFLRVELAEIQRRVTMIQESIDLRDQVARQIIERRVSELLDPNLQWEPASTPAIGPGGFIDSNGAQWPRPAGMPGGMGPGAEGAGGLSSSGSNGKVSFTSPPVRNAPGNTGIVSGFGGSTAADPVTDPGSIGSGDKSDVSTSAATDGDVAKPSNTGPVWMLHMSAPWRGAERDAPAIVIDANDQRSILLSASWSAQRFPIGEEGAPVESMTLVGSKLPVRLIATDEQLGVAIYSVPGKLVPWPADQLSSEVGVGDVVDELSSAGHFGPTTPVTAHHVLSVGNTFVSETSIPKDAKVEGAFVLDGRMSGNPGSILLKDGKLAGMFLNNSQSADSGGLKPYALPTKALLERAHQLIERSEAEVRQKLIQR